MGIQITNAESKPAITYDKIHVTQLEIIQPTFIDDTLQPKYTIRISYRCYGVVDNVRYYKTEELHTVIVEDFISEAMILAQQGNTTLITALQSIESAVAAILINKVGISASVI